MTFRIEFFEVVAGLIPVLFLALVVEERLREPGETAMDRLLRTTTLALLILSEVIALLVVATGKDPGFGVFVASTLAVSGLLILAPVVLEGADNAKTRREKVTHVAIGGFVTLLALALVFTA